MRLQSAILSDLIVQAEAIVTRPPVMLPLKVLEGLAAVGAELRAADRRPAEAERVTTWALVLLTALEQWTSAQRCRAGGEVATMSLMVAGVALPLVRRDVGIAISNEREVRG